MKYKIKTHDKRIWIGFDLFSIARIKNKSKYCVNCDNEMKLECFLNLSHCLVKDIEKDVKRKVKKSKWDFIPDGCSECEFAKNCRIFKSKKYEDCGIISLG